MMTEREIPRAGEFYLHFKGKLYQTIAVAKHTETGEDLVIYQALYGNYGIYARPLAMFMSRVDREKYPQSAQEYRFEKVEAGTKPYVRQEEEPAQTSPEETAGEIRQEASGEAASLEPLFQFLDAGDWEEKRNILIQYRSQWTESMLDAMGVSMDCVLSGGSVEEKYYELDKVIRTKFQYEKRPR